MLRRIRMVISYNEGSVFRESATVVSTVLTVNVQSTLKYCKSTAVR